jgi:hypothetical protein
MTPTMAIAGEEEECSGDKEYRVGDAEECRECGSSDRGYVSGVMQKVAHWA